MLRNFYRLQRKVLQIIRNGDHSETITSADNHDLFLFLLLAFFCNKLSGNGDLISGVVLPERQESQTEGILIRIQMNWFCLEFKKSFCKKLNKFQQRTNKSYKNEPS